ncbi:hypothetical protein [Patulibacter minatonensis]|uniref:hypothetical protein n=1 Tax=Patulibacter minatonensis TaxID=298163 RepID=UPI00047928AF|nr:hypothetical protein [Patulibacter minatonensis]
MQLAALQPLAPIVAGGVLLYGAGSLKPDGALGRARKAGLVTLLTVGAVGAIVGLFLLMGTLLESHPAQMPFLLLAVVAIFAVLYVLTTGRKDPPLPSETRRTDEGGGGGGQRRPTPPPPPEDPPGPATPDLPWDEFDDLRSGWERVPAGHV